MDDQNCVAPVSNSSWSPQHDWNLSPEGPYLILLHPPEYTFWSLSVQRLSNCLLGKNCIPPWVPGGLPQSSADLTLHGLPVRGAALGFHGGRRPGLLSLHSECPAGVFPLGSNTVLLKHLCSLILADQQGLRDPYESSVQGCAASWMVGIQALGLRACSGSAE